MAVEGYPFACHFGHMKLLGRASPGYKNILMISPYPFYVFGLFDTLKVLLLWAGEMLLCWGGEARGMV